jgi:hypothetical protein
MMNMLSYFLDQIKNNYYFKAFINSSYLPLSSFAIVVFMMSCCCLLSPNVERRKSIKELKDAIAARDLTILCNNATFLLTFFSRQFDSQEPGEEAVPRKT